MTTRAIPRHPATKARVDLAAYQARWAETITPKDAAAISGTLAWLARVEATPTKRVMAAKAAPATVKPATTLGIVPDHAGHAEVATRTADRRAATRSTKPMSARERLATQPAAPLPTGPIERGAMTLKPRPHRLPAG